MLKTRSAAAARWPAALKPGRAAGWLTAGMATMLVAACSASSSGGSGSSSGPITVGISVSLSGDFSGDGLATKQGYETWAAFQNAHGGILGRKVKLEFLSDGSSPTQVVTNYQKLITLDHVNFVAGPYSTLLTKPASVIAHRYNYVMLEGIGGGPSVFQQGLHSVYDVSASAKYQMITFAKWLVATQKPEPVAYASMTDPFLQPMLDGARSYLTAHGFTSAVYKLYPVETTDFPKILIEASGPDQGAAFVKAVGAKNTQGIMVPNTWYPGSTFYQNSQMVALYLKMFGGSAANISADVAEAFSTGQVLAQAVTHIKSTSNAKLNTYLQSGAGFQSVQGPVQFASDGENKAATPYVFQWQNGQLVDVLPLGVGQPKPIQVVKTPWGQTP